MAYSLMHNFIIPKKKLEFDQFRMETDGKNDDVIDKICNATFPLVTAGIRSSGTLPPSGESFEFYQSYPAFSVSLV